MKKTTQDQAAILQAARKALDMTEAELAQELGKSEDTLISWRLGRRNMPANVRTLLSPIATKYIAEAKERRRILADHRAKKK